MRGFVSPQAGRVTESTSRSFTRDANAAERVDHVDEAVEVDEGVVVDADPQERRDRLLEGGRARVGATGEERRVLQPELVERVQRRPESLHRRACLADERNVDVVPRDAHRDRTARIALEADDDHRVGAVADSLGPVVGADQEQRHPRAARSTRSAMPGSRRARKPGRRPRAARCGPGTASALRAAGDRPPERAGRRGAASARPGRRLLARRPLSRGARRAAPRRRTRSRACRSPGSRSTPSRRAEPPSRRRAPRARPAAGIPGPRARPPSRHASTTANRRMPSTARFSARRPAIVSRRTAASRGSTGCRTTSVPCHEDEHGARREERRPRAREPLRRAGRRPEARARGVRPSDAGPCGQCRRGESYRCRVAATAPRACCSNGFAR